MGGLYSQVTGNFHYLFYFLRGEVFDFIAKNVDKFLLITVKAKDLAFQEILTDLLDSDVLP